MSSDETAMGPDKTARSPDDAVLKAIKWNPQGLVPAIAQDHVTGEVLMQAWMNRQAFACTVTEGRAVYWSRSRQALWRKGEESGNVQELRELRLDCDGDTVLLKVEQIGGIACHTGRKNCFFRKLEDNNWSVIEPVVRAPNTMYGDKS